MHIQIDKWVVRDYNVTMLSNTMKLRRIGNSLGTTFSREILQKAGLTGDEEIEVIVGNGEIKLRRTSERVVVEFTKAEAAALAATQSETKAAESALNKVRKLVAAEQEAHLDSGPVCVGRNCRPAN